jgi:deoxyribodipyrimidine photolyase-related protein
MSKDSDSPLRQLVVVLGDQLDLISAAFDVFDPQHDAVWMAEVAEESTHVWSHKARIAVFLSAMRHFRNYIRNRGWNVIYRQLDDPDNLGSFSAEIRDVVRRRHPRKLVLVEPGEFRVKQAFDKTPSELQLDLEVRPDRHFVCSHDEFDQHAEGRKQLRVEYRHMRRATGMLIDDGQPTGGACLLLHAIRKLQREVNLRTRSLLMTACATPD